MNENETDNVFEGNIRRLLNTTASGPSPDFDGELIESVLAEVQMERSRLRYRLLAGKKWIFAAATAALIVIVVNVFWKREITPQQVGQVRPVYGFVSLQDGAPPQKITQKENIHSGQWIKTHSGSRAEIVLKDKSKLFIQPRTTIQIEEKKRGEKVMLREGFIKVAAAKQPAGRALTIEAPASQIKVLGTELEVHVVQKPDGRKQARVSVTSGKVELESAGQKVFLPPNTEGIAEKGRPPIRRSLTLEVNEMLRLLEENERLAAEAKLSAGVPTIIDFNDDASATVWTILPINNQTNTYLQKYMIKPASADSEIKAFTLEGASLRVIGEKGRWQIDLSLAPVPPGEQTKVIVRITNVEGLFANKGAGVFEFNRPPGSPECLSLFQFRLPASASVEKVSPTHIETRKTLSRLVVTISADTQMTGLFY
ncbi:MAG: FecR domain-containing protein [Planctomycetota bacterium]|nr:MAG: FecR domain-containing protein [Planctomycetota bacterium]